MNSKIFRLRTVKDLTGLSRSTIYAMMKTGAFPKNIKLGANSVGWTEADIQGWIDSRIALSK